jgi:hypothetical protein
LLRRTDFSKLVYYSPQVQQKHAVRINADVCIYGGSSAGVAAAVQASRLGLKAIIVEFGTHVGGMTTSGLGRTDIGNKGAIGGLSREFYRHLGKYYGEEETWFFEPSAAEEIYHKMLTDSGVTVYFEQHLASVEKKGEQIKKITMENGNVFTADIFMDCTYEGDLLAMAGVSYHVGREANSTYKETLNGIHFGHPNHNFKAWVDPYVREGNPDSGLLPGVVDQEAGLQGQGDKSVQAYNFRVCLSYAENRIPFPEPPNYDPSRYELLLRYINAGVWDALQLNKMMPNLKTDLNNFGAVSTDHIGSNHNWPEGDYETREKIFQDHVTYNLGMLHFLANDERLPSIVREETRQWGLPVDEFTETGGWPHQLYVREGRRMVSDIVMTEHDCRGYRVVNDSIGLASYQLDSHNCRRIVIDGRCINEGNVEIAPTAPYPISYRSIVPKQEECSNLFVPVCLSSSHIAYGSIRMEPVFMILGQSAATAAVLALEKGCSVQEVDYSMLRARLIEGEQVLEWKSKQTSSL